MIKVEDTKVYIKRSEYSVEEALELAYKILNACDKVEPGLAAIRPEAPIRMNQKDFDQALGLWPRFRLNIDKPKYPSNEFFKEWEFSQVNLNAYIDGLYVDSNFKQTAEMTAVLKSLIKNLVNAAIAKEYLNAYIAHRELCDVLRTFNYTEEMGSAIKIFHPFLLPLYRNATLKEDLDRVCSTAIQIARRAQEPHFLDTTVHEMPEESITPEQLERLKECRSGNLGDEIE